ncbi:MAG: hypothetical protein KDE27_23365 [Planctomycetes bacterium]|nr:hypothetical protein [Planctomycetota bacterium]
MRERCGITALAIAVGAIAALAAAAPIWTYALSLAVFGVPHVLVELRYVDERFAARLPRSTLCWLGLGLGAIVAGRVLGLAEIGSGPNRVVAELVIGAGLVAAAVPMLARRGSLAVALLLLALLLSGAAFAPLPTLVGLTLLHNLTPVGFLAERLDGRARRRALRSCLVVFGVVPALLLAGAFDAAIGGITISPLADGPFGAGSLDANLPVFVPAPLLGTPFADRLFAAAAFLQCMHYAVVLGVLPRLGGGDARPGAVLPWPPRTIWAIAIGGIGLATAFAFASEFAGARGSYGVLAAVHAWLELPILVVACGSTARLPAALAAT